MFGSSDDTVPGRSLVADLRSGDAGCLPRIGLSVAAAFGLIALALTLLWSFSYLSRYATSPLRVRDEHVAIALLLALAVWLFLLTRIWRGYRRGKNLLLTIFGVLAIWAAASTLGVVFDIILRRDGELLIAASVLAAVCGSIALITTRWYSHTRGRPMQTSEGQVNVRCPQCAYSMVGLHESRCPECGSRYTIDELILRQEYAALHRKTSPTPPPEQEAEPELEPPTAPPFVIAQT